MPIFEVTIYVSHKPGWPHWAPQAPQAPLIVRAQSDCDASLCALEALESYLVVPPGRTRWRDPAMMTCAPPTDSGYPEEGTTAILAPCEFATWPGLGS
jgi:hypothetical protein